MNDDMTCAQFNAVIMAAAAEMARQWSEQAARDPQMFPDAMSAQSWWLHFSTVTMPDHLLRLSTRSAAELCPAEG